MKNKARNNSSTQHREIGPGDYVFYLTGRTILKVAEFTNIDFRYYIDAYSVKGVKYTENIIHFTKCPDQKLSHKLFILKGG